MNVLWNRVTGPKPYNDIRLRQKRSVDAAALVVESGAIGSFIGRRNSTPGIIAVANLTIVSQDISCHAASRYGTSTPRM